MKSCLIGVFSLIFLVGSITAQAGRDIKNFDAGWLFSKGEIADGHRSELDDSSWRKLDVPHDWSIEGPIDAKNPTGGAGGFFPSGVSWYRKHFTLADNARNKRVFIEFDGVMENSEVWVNGQYLGKRPYGYSSFSYDMTGKLNFGRGAKNVLSVKADTSKQPASRWYTGAGIYRHVRLVIKDDVHIPQWGTFVTTPSVSEKEATVNVSSEVLNTTSAAKDIMLDVSLLDPKGKVVAAGASKPQAVSPGIPFILKYDLIVKNPDRWHVEHGAMYKAVAGEVRRQDAGRRDGEFWNSRV